MIISRKSVEITRTIDRTEGHGKKERKVPLFTIAIPSQTIAFSVPAGEIVDAPIAIQVDCHQPGSNMPQTADGSWPLQMFTEFVQGVRSVTEIATPFIKDDPDVTAEARITDTTYVWSRFETEKVAGGMFSQSKFEYFQKVNFRILGLDSLLVRWESDMLNPFVELRDEFLKQREEFKQLMLQRSSR